MGKDGSQGPCLACGMAPCVGPEWLNHAHKPGVERGIPVGHCCIVCFKKNKDGWPHLSFVQYSEHIKTHEGQEEVAAYATNIEAGRG